jgi:hydroxymethylbilane synthase
LALKNKSTITIGSRGSKLALWQAEWVKAELEGRNSQITVLIEIIKTTGDTVKDQPLTVIGGKGVFAKELEDALLDERIDLAVHSLKDLPTMLPNGLSLAAITKREDVRDALVLTEGASAELASIQTLPRGAVIGTSSQRRIAQLKHHRPDIEIKDLRGNVDTRMRKLDAGWYDAIILACAGLRRLELSHRISQAIPIDQMLPAIGQGALGIEIRTDDLQLNDIVKALVHQPTRDACIAERSLLRALGGGCLLPIAGYARMSNDSLIIEGLVADPDGSRLIRNSVQGSPDKAEELGQRVADSLLKLGANDLLDAFHI